MCINNCMLRMSSLRPRAHFCIIHYVTYVKGILTLLLNANTPMKGGQELLFDQGAVLTFPRSPAPPCLSNTSNRTISE